MKVILVFFFVIFIPCCMCFTASVCNAKHLAYYNRYYRHNILTIPRDSTVVAAAARKKDTKDTNPPVASEGTDKATNRQKITSKSIAPSAPPPKPASVSPMSEVRESLDDDINTQQFGLELERLMAGTKVDAIDDSRRIKVDDKTHINSVSNRKNVVQSNVNALLALADNLNLPIDNDKSNDNESGSDSGNNGVAISSNNGELGKILANDLENIVNNANDTGDEIDLGWDVSQIGTLENTAQSARDRLFKALSDGLPEDDCPMCPVCKIPAEEDDLAYFGKCSFCRQKELAEPIKDINVPYRYSQRSLQDGFISKKSETTQNKSAADDNNDSTNNMNANIKTTAAFLKAPKPRALVPLSPSPPMAPIKSNLHTRVTLVSNKSSGESWPAVPEGRFQEPPLSRAANENVNSIYQLKNEDYDDRYLDVYENDTVEYSSKEVLDRIYELETDNIRLNGEVNRLMNVESTLNGVAATIWDLEDQIQELKDMVTGMLRVQQIQQQTQVKNSSKN